MDDASDFSWISAKASHAVLLCRMEQGEVRSYADILAIARIRNKSEQTLKNICLYRIQFHLKILILAKSLAK